MTLFIQLTLPLQWCCWLPLPWVTATTEDNVDTNLGSCCLSDPLPPCQHWVPRCAPCWRKVGIKSLPQSGGEWRWCARSSPSAIGSAGPVRQGEERKVGGRGRKKWADGRGVAWRGGASFQRYYFLWSEPHRYVLVVITNLQCTLPITCH